MSDSGAKDVVARDLMMADYPRIHENEILGEAISKLVALGADPASPSVLIVVDEDGRYEGILTARLLFRCLLGHWMPSKAAHEDMQQLDEDLLSAVAEQSQRKIGDALIRGLPKAKPGDGVLTLMELGCEKRMEYIPVVDNGTAVGIVPISKLFHAVASMALTPEDDR